MMPKALYGAVWVIKNVYCDGAERLTERVLLFTSYRCGLIHSTERLRSQVEWRWIVGSRGAGSLRCTSYMKGLVLQPLCEAYCCVLIIQCIELKYRYL